MRKFVFAALLASAALSTAFVNPDPAPVVQTTEPLVFAFEGQSNMQGQGDSALSPNLPVSEAQEFIHTPSPVNQWSGYLVAKTYDPISRNLNTHNKSNTGSLIPSLLQRVYQLKNRKIFFCMTAVQGSFIWGGWQSVPNNNNWSPTGIYLPNANKKIKAMQMQAAVPDRLDMLFVGLGEADFTNVHAYPTKYTYFPNGFVVTTADSIPDGVGGYMNYPNGFSNPNNLPNIYDNFHSYYKSRMDQLGCKLVVMGTGRITVGTAAHIKAGKMAGGFQKFIVKRLVSEGYAAGYCGKAYDLVAYLKTDGTHFTQPGYNLLGEAGGDKAAGML